MDAEAVRFAISALTGLEFDLGSQKEKAAYAKSDQLLSQVRTKEFIFGRNLQRNLYLESSIFQLKRNHGR